MGGCQNYGPFLGTLNIRGRIIIGIQKGIIILTTTHMNTKEEYQLDNASGRLLVQFSALLMVMLSKWRNLLLLLRWKMLQPP